MADDGIQFGDVEEQQPAASLRPDQNRHYAVVAHGRPGAGDLPVYVDLDVLLDMERHALSDTRVELGGVLLGGQHHDDEGRPFVVVTDSLRAQHYESTKGSFKFTHDTWEAISRERDQFPPDLQMVGWYHTHPDWGVFLSGMDLFICNNFFNKRLDVAYVIDPCRDDRAFFMWNGDAAKGVRRTGGFFVMASRFRADELANVVEQVEAKEEPMRMLPTGGGGAPQVIVTGPPPKPAWEGLAVMGMLTAQFLLLALLAWKVLAPPPAPTAAAPASAVTREVAKQVLAELRGGEPTVAERLAGSLAEVGELKIKLEHAEQMARDALVAARSAQERQTAAESKLGEVNRELKLAQAALQASTAAKNAEPVTVLSWLQANGLLLFAGALVLGLAGLGAYLATRPPPGSLSEAPSGPRSKQEEARTRETTTRPDGAPAAAQEKSAAEPVPPRASQEK